MILKLIVIICFSVTQLFAESRPNVLFISIDDLRPELGIYGTKALTPNIDKLAKSGVRFDRAYCNQAVCGASRISLMTGLYPEKTGERSFHVTGWRERFPDTVTLNQHFMQNGYNTVGLGKIYHNSSGEGVDLKHWSQWLTVSGSYYVNADSSNNIRVSGSKTKTKRRGPSTEIGVSETGEYLDSKRAKKAVEMLESLAKEDAPFFLAVGFDKPHLPFCAPKKFWDLYQREGFSMPENAGVPDGYPEYAAELDAGELRSYSDVPEKGVPTTDFSEELNKRLLHGYHACVSYMDHNVGMVLDALEKSGVSENTIVVFWGDHGWKLGDHSSWCKHTNFECDTRVPLIIRAPGKGKGQSVALVELIDLYPTLCDLTGIKKPDHIQGDSFLQTLIDPTKQHRDFSYSSYVHGGKVGHSIRTPKYRYTEWWKKEDDTFITRAMTDINADPGETTSALKGNKEAADALSEQLRKRVLEVR